MAAPITEEQFRKNIYHKYAEHFRHVYQLHQFAEDAMQRYRSFAATAYHVSLWLIFARAYKSYDSTRRLCEVASCEDAAVVLRSLLNLLAVTRWISLDPEKRGGKYLAWYWVQMYNDARTFADRVPKAWIPIIQKNYDRVKVQFEYTDRKGRYHVAQQWYQPDAHGIRDLFEQTNLVREYDEGYKPLSSIEHTDAMAFMGMLTPMDKSTGESRLEIQSDMFIPHYLRNGFQYFGDIFRISNSGIKLADAAKLDGVLSEGIKFFEADMKSRGMTS